MRNTLHLIALWCALIVLAALHVIHTMDRNLTVRSLTVVNHLGDERIVLRTLGPDGAYVDLSDGSGDNNENRVQLYTIGATYSAGICVNDGLGAGHRYGGIELLTSPLTGSQLHTIGRDGGSITIAPPAVTTHPPGTFPGLYLETIQNISEFNRSLAAKQKEGHSQ